MTQEQPYAEKPATDIVKQYHQLLVTLERLKQEVEEASFFSDTHENYFEEERYLEKVKSQVRDIQQVVDWYRDFS
ncbi:hypothetical protein CJU90_6011 [Yarrowia sp. C11]|nr:hypothetical protein CJU90_6011 [Yarrowia sp. C11]